MSLIESKLAKELLTPRGLPIQVEVTVADGHKVHCKYYCNLIVEIEDRRIVIQPFLVYDLLAPLIFGALEMGPA